MPDNPRRQEPQARSEDRGIDDDHDGASLDGGNSEAFRSGNVEVAFQGFLATPELIRPADQRPEVRRIIGDDGSDRLPWTEAFGT